MLVRCKYDDNDKISCYWIRKWMMWIDYIKTNLPEYITRKQQRHNIFCNILGIMNVDIISNVENGTQQLPSLVGAIVPKLASYNGIVRIKRL